LADHNSSAWQITILLLVIPECIVLGKMSRGHCLPNGVTAYERVAKMSALV